VANDPWYELTMAASNLKVGLPEQYAKLVEAFKQLEEKMKMDLFAADAGVILNAQGQASMVAKIRERIEQCLEKRQHYQNRA
jgi:anthranilate phosphoribosyltransferase